MLTALRGRFRDTVTPSTLRALLDLRHRCVQVNLVQAYLKDSGVMPARLKGQRHHLRKSYPFTRRYSPPPTTGSTWRSATDGSNGQACFLLFAAWSGPDWAGDPRLTTNAQRVQERGVLIPLIEAVMRIGL